MAFHDLSKLGWLLDSAAARGEASPMRSPSLHLLALLGAALWHTTPAAGQAAIASDLWRVAAGTLAVPAAIASDGSAALWTPAILVPPGGWLRVGVESVHSPSEIGVNGALAAVALRAGRVTLNAVYGRMGLDDLVRTETSPEALGGSIPVYAQVLSLGAARPFGASFTAGAAARLLSGRLATRGRAQLGIDLGLVYSGVSRLRLGVATRFFDPTLGEAEQASSYEFGVEYGMADLTLGATRSDVRLRYGATASHGEGVQHLLSAGLGIGGALALDLGAAREQSAGGNVWRSRSALGVTAGRYRVQVGRDGGANGFGATYRFGVAAMVR